MSDTGAGGLFTTMIFNPALLGKEDLVRGFVARQDLLARLLDDMRRVQPGNPPQHQLLMGQRGLGKTTLLRRLAFAIEDDRALSAAWMPLVFPEEQYNVKNLGDFWLNCADALSDALDRGGDQKAAEALDRKVESVPADPERRSAAALALLVDEAQRLGRGLVLLVDNLDIVLDRLDRKEEWEFRRVISGEHRLYFIGASSRALEALYEHGRAFYDYFQIHDLMGLSEAEMFALLERMAKEDGDDQVERLVREKPARVRALRVLTGGNPRTLMLLYRVLSQGPEGDVQRDMEQLLDLYTPLYKARFEEMAPQSQQVVDAMAIHWDPVTAGDLAGRLAPLSVNQVSAQLNRLEAFGIVEKAPWFGEKKAAFQIAERFFNIWYLMRASRRVRRRLVWLVKFLEAWFEREEIGERARLYLQRDPKGDLLQSHPGRYEESEQAYRRAIELGPQFPYPWGNLARLMERDSDRQEAALAAFFKAAELDPTNGWRRWEALRIARAVGMGPHLPAALQAVSNLHESFPEDRESQFALGGLLALSGDWKRAWALLQILASEMEQPDIWTFGAAVKAGHLLDALALLEQTGADERWRPLYEALRAVQAGSAQYLRRVAPEVRTIAETILAQIAPDLMKG
jgi:tetratricopeptide (TPR) repeat protein